MKTSINLITPRRIDAFEKRVKKTSTCWIWTGHANGSGYGVFARKKIKAHRFSWEIHFSAPGDQCVLHRCDVRHCVRPSHLFLGNRADNSDDKMAKGRQAKGTTLPQARLDERTVREIRIEARRSTYDQLCAKFGIGRNTAWQLVNRRTWAWVL